jgi:NitT/TauT family transport system ATP-binding protein
MTPSPMVQVTDVRKCFARRAAEALPALDGISFSVGLGEFVSIVGTSGCGKTTLLNIIAGLLAPDQGHVTVGGRVVSGVNRNVGYVFQQASLLPWLSVRANVELGMKVRGVAAKTRAEVADSLISQVGLGRFADAFPHQLSGGMAKRAEIIRVLAIDPDLLLMDEPFGALDAQTKIHMQNMLLVLLQQEARKTVIFITHDLEEAVTLSDRVITMSAHPGRIKRQHVIGLPRPRDSRQARLNPRFSELLRPVWDDIEPSNGASDVA